MAITDLSLSKAVNTGYRTGSSIYTDEKTKSWKVTKIFTQSVASRAINTVSAIGSAVKVIYIPISWGADLAQGIGSIFSDKPRTWTYAKYAREEGQKAAGETLKGILSLINPGLNSLQGTKPNEVQTFVVNPDGKLTAKTKAWFEARYRLASQMPTTAKAYTQVASRRFWFTRGITVGKAFGLAGARAVDAAFSIPATIVSIGSSFYADGQKSAQAFATSGLAMLVPAIGAAFLLKGQDIKNWKTIVKAAAFCFIPDAGDTLSKLFFAKHEELTQDQQEAKAQQEWKDSGFFAKFAYYIPGVSRMVWGS